MDPTEFDAPGHGEELLPESRRSPLWRWVVVGAVGVAATALTLRVLDEDGRNTRHAADSSSVPPTVRVVEPVTRSRANAGWAAPRLDAPHVPCPAHAGCAYIVGPTTVQDSAALPSAFPGAVVHHSVTFFAIRQDATKVLSRRVVASRGAARIVVTLRAARRFPERTQVRAESVEVAAFVDGYAVLVTVHDPAEAAAVCVRRASSLAHDRRLLLARAGLRG